MKNLRLFLVSCLLIAFMGCEDDDIRSTDFVDDAAAPSEVQLQFRTTQDNSGLVTITPTAVGATQFDILFGDGTGNSVSLDPGQSADNAYAEGTYTVTVTATGINGLITEAQQQLVVSFQAPQNLVVTIENDAATSKQVNVNATADFAMSYDVFFGEPGIDTPVSGNIGETVSYVYQNPGTYTITVVAMGAAIETTTYTEDFEVTEILAPVVAAPTPPARADADVVSVFSDAYTDVTLDELPTVWSSSGFEAITIGDDNLWKLTNLDFLGIVTNYANGIDVSAMETLHIDYWVPDGTTNELLVKIVNTVDGGEDIQSFGTTVAGSWQSIDIDMSLFVGDLANTEKITQLIIDSDGVAGVVYIDNFYFYRSASVTTPFDDGLLTNGDFQNGSDQWLVGVDDNSSAPVVTVDGNTYYSVDVTSASPGQPFLVNVSQKVEIIQDAVYTLSFDAWSNVNRSIIAGIGLSGGDFSNTSETVNITPTVTNYTLMLTAAGFGAIDARVLFDLAAEIGTVNIDNVSLNIMVDNLLTNGDFENGSDSWLVGVDDNSAAPVVTVDGNTYYSVNVDSANPSQPFLVNVSQKLEIIQDATYTLTFDAWSDVDRSIIAGIGLSGGDFSNTNETVNISPTVTTYTLTLLADGFGALDARVLFDLAAETGMVNIDNVILSLN